jgi:uncharacterized protein
MPTADHNRETPGQSDAPRRRSWRRLIVRIIVIYAFVPYAAVVLIFTVMQRTFLYPATKAENLAADTTSLPAGTIHDLSVVTRDGIELRGWLILAEGRSATSELELADELVSYRKTVLYFPGNSGNRRLRSADLRELTRRNLNVICFDYRGYGDSRGHPSEAALVNDAWEIWEFATIQNSISPENLLLFGESLGGSVAVQIAARASREGHPPAALILSSTFLSMTDNVQRVYPYFPVRLMLWDTWRSDWHAGEIDCPVLMFHGTADEFVPRSAARSLFELFPKRGGIGLEHQWCEIDGGSHNEIPPQLLKDKLDSLLSAISASRGLP